MFEKREVLNKFSKMGIQGEDLANLRALKPSAKDKDRIADIQKRAGGDTAKEKGQAEKVSKVMKDFKKAYARGLAAEQAKMSEVADIFYKKALDLVLHTPENKQSSAFSPGNNRNKRCSVSDKKLREELIRLAHTKPELRAHLLPLVAQEPGEEGAAPNPEIPGTAYGALLYASWVLVELGMYKEEQILTMIRRKLLRQSPAARSRGTVVSKEMLKRYGLK